MLRQKHINRLASSFICILLVTHYVFAQNMVGDGFGGLSWYKPYSMSAGCYSGFAICGDDHQLYSWGHNEFAELGVGHTTPMATPQKVKGMTDVFFVSTGYLSGVIRGDLSAWVWGEPYGGIPFKLMDDVRYLSAGDRSITIIKYDGTVWHLGNNVTGKFGNGDHDKDVFVDGPEQMVGITNAVRAANGSYSTAILTEDGYVYAAGRNYHGGLGQPESVIDAKFPMKIEGLKDIVNIKATAFGYAALDRNGDVWGWGMWIEGKKIFEPIKLQGLSNVVTISGKNDGWHFMALTENKDVYVWGRNQYSQMGTNSSGGDKFQPHKIINDVVEIMAGETFSYIIKSDGTFHCVGMSKEGSIWLNLEDKRRFNFTEIPYQDAPINLCKARRRINIYLDTLICENESVYLFGKEFTSSGRYFETRTHGECDSVIVLDLIKGNHSTHTQEIKLCGNETITIGSNTYNSAGTYSDTLVSITGCDSILTTIITEGDPTTYSQEVTLCFNESLTVGNSLYDVSGVYQDILPNKQGCDSIINTTLTILPEDLQIITYDLCEGDSVNVLGSWYAESMSVDDRYTNVQGCDSTIQYDIVVHSEAFTEDTFRFCPWDPFVVGNRSFYELGTYEDTLQTIWGCDSVAIVHIDTFMDWTCYEPTWHAPGAFTPNGDNLNETFKVHGVALEKVDLRIYNRWGEKLYEGDGIREGWNGKYMGEPCQQGVYMYIASIRTVHRERVMLKGTITLLR